MKPVVSSSGFCKKVIAIDDVHGPERLERRGQPVAQSLGPAKASAAAACKLPQSPGDQLNLSFDAGILRLIELLP